jgi:molybdopterin synthase sulfur carrier subunit
MQVSVRLYATLVRIVPDRVSKDYPDGIRAGAPLSVELTEGSTLDDLVETLGLPPEKVRVTFVNGRAQQRNYHIAPGDEIGIFPPVGGG